MTFFTQDKLIIRKLELYFTDQKPQVDPNPRQPRLEDTSSEDSLQFKYRLIPPPPVDQVITPAPTPTPLKVYSYSPTMPPNTNVVNSLPPLKKPEYLGGFIQPPAALHSYHQYPGYFPEPYIIEKKAEVSAGKLRLEPQKKKTGYTIKKTKPGFPKQPRTVVPPPDIEHVAPPVMPPPRKENPRNGKSKIHYQINAQWLKITEKVSFNIVSKASYARLHFEWTKMH